MKPFKVYLEYRKKKIVTVLAEDAREAAREALSSSDKFIDISELEVEVDAFDYEEEN